VCFKGSTGSFWGQKWVNTYLGRYNRNDNLHTGIGHKIMADPRGLIEPEQNEKKKKTTI